MRTRSRPEISWPSTLNQRPSQADDPGQAEQQREAGEHGQAIPSVLARSRWSSGNRLDQDGDEDDVIDAQHDFERQQGRQRHPGLGHEYPL